jgi:D-beta-D-heptose 7-phosphate kinase / D-beta-D-heptose 1-phosphate adenosyltransferase
VRTPPRAFLSVSEAAGIVRTTQASGGVVVFAEGIFDLLHPGYVRYLQDAKALGTFLLVGVESDATARSFIGPLNNERERAEILLALGCVDAVVLVDGQAIRQLLGVIRPDVAVAQGEGEARVDPLGFRLVRIASSPDYSIGDLVQRVKALQRG